MILRKTGFCSQPKSLSLFKKQGVENDQVIQQNTASAEKSASASEEMNHQAERVKQFVDKLILLPRGGKSPHRHSEK